MRRVDEKVALVTGAARGIGTAIAEKLHAEGATVVVTDVNVEEGSATAAGIDADGTTAVFYEQDVTDEQGWTDIVARTVAQFGRLDILVNNAGVAAAGTVEDETLARWRWLQSINLDAVFMGTKAAITQMKTTGGGSIVNIASIEALIAEPELAAYNASKGGVRIFSKSAALHCAKAGYGIRVNTVCPGYVWTPMFEGFASASGDKDAAVAAVAARHPIGRLGQPVDIANAVLFLASDESSFVTGSDIVVDGGYTAQ